MFNWHRILTKFIFDQKDRFIVKQTVVAKRSDGNSIPMPKLNKALMVRDKCSAEIFALVSQGLIPNSMDEKWFIYYEDPWLYIHRSLSGICVFKIKFQLINEHYEIVTALVNRDAEQYNETDDARDIAMLRELLRSLVERNEHH